MSRYGTGMKSVQAIWKKRNKTVACLCSGTPLVSGYPESTLNEMTLETNKKECQETGDNAEGRPQ